MKKILKKLTALALVIAMLTPFIELPVAQAATDNSGCTNHLQTYLWLDVNYFKNGNEKFMEEYASTGGSASGGYKTYTNFPYQFFDTDKYKINIISVKENNFTDSSSMDADLKIFLDETKKAVNETEEFSQTEGGKLVIDAKLSGYKDHTLLRHGYWASFDNLGKTVEENWPDTTKKYEDINQSLQKMLDKKTGSKFDYDNMKIVFGRATFNNNQFGDTSNSGAVDANYFQEIIDGNTKIWSDSINNKKYIPLSITRTIDMSKEQIKEMLNKYNFGYTDKENNKKYIYSTDASTVTDSYSALTSSPKSVYPFTGDEKIDFDVDTPYYWPSVITVEYQACPIANTGEWNLVYNGNVSDNSVTGLPKSEKIKLATNANISETIPKRNGYTFQGWCRGTSQCDNLLKSGTEIQSPTTDGETVTLYAQWGQTGSEKQEPTGVMSYVLGFISVGIIAGGIYLIAKKKNLFKQI